jgi:uncharacterized membrane protein
MPMTVWSQVAELWVFIENSIFEHGQDQHRTVTAAMRLE